MAFFSSSEAYDSQLRRKRSTSTTRSIGKASSDKATDDTSLRKRSTSAASSPSSALVSDRHEPPPPLPTPVSAGISRLRTPVFSDTHDPASTSYDQSSTPVPFTKQSKHISPPPFSNLLVNVSKPRSNEFGEGSRRSHSSTRTPVSQSVALGSAGTLPPEDNSLDHLPDSASGLHSPPMVQAEVPRQRRFSSRISPKLPPLKPPSPRTNLSNSETVSNTLPTPISPPKRRVESSFEQLPPIRSLGHAHFRSHSATTTPTNYAFESGPGSTKSSLARSPLQDWDVMSATTVDPSSRFACDSGMSTPTHEGKPLEKPPRNVLRKRSAVSPSRQNEPNSAPTSDSEKKSKKRHPRSRSLALPLLGRRNSIGAVFDLMQPLPVKPITDVDLTPAGDIRVAYKESQQHGFMRETFKLPSSGEIIAVGSEDDQGTGPIKSPWTAGWRTAPSNNENADERDAEKKSNRLKGLTRKLSAKWGTKEGERRIDESSKKVELGGTVVDASRRRATLHGEGKKSPVVPSYAHGHSSPSRSPVTGQGKGQVDDDARGRVWEEEIGGWVGKHLQDNNDQGKEEEGASNTGRLWRLVKRFSSGSLKEKRSPPLEAPPPVPPLPKNFDQKHIDNKPEVDIDRGEMPYPHSPVPETPGGIRRYITSVPSLSIPRLRPSTSGTRSSGAPRRREPTPSDSSPSSALSRTNAGHRTASTGIPSQTQRSTTTSSSPSSETTNLFSRSRSSSASASSYGEAVPPPMPSIPAHVGKHIITPMELHALLNEKDGGGPPSCQRSSSKLRTASDASPTGSATIPLFDAQSPVNKFPPYKGRRPAQSSIPRPSKDQDPIIEASNHTQPPPIPQRSPRRLNNHSVSVPSLPLPVKQHSIPNVVPIRDSPESNGSEALRLRLRPPTAPKPRPRSISDGAVDPDRYISAIKSPLTFREMTSTQRQLTEQEKNTKWEDLLQRSAKAGGTLHVGSPDAAVGLALWSDRSSLALSETLDRY
ncbi:hypothetical protein K439DRAFT_964554 [Ramaria rubella]|nr:hypothetical protein K439DRAFT_964554 [Ramaria rubella]